MKNSKIIFVLLYITVLILSMFIEPTGDDWLFLRFFDNHSDWDVEGHTWLYNQMLLERDYWRPIEDILLKTETYIPVVYPYLNHFITVTSYYIIAYLLYLLMGRIKVANKIAFISSIIFLILATNMGSLLSVDGFTMVWAVLFGMIYVQVYISQHRFRKLILVLAGIFCCLSKETGFVFLIIAPVYKWLIYTLGNDISSIKELPWKNIIKDLLLSAIPVLIYLSLWYVQYEALNETLNETFVAQNAIENNHLKDIIQGTGGYSLTPVLFMKNVLILYGLAIVPIDTSAIYYGNWILLVVSGILSISGLYLSIIALKKIQSNLLPSFIMICLIFIASLPSLITRAGEMSSLPSNIFIVLFFSFIFNKMNIDRKLKNAIFIFVLATLLTDVHKYYLGVTGGRIGKEMAETIKELSGETPDNVLWIGTTSGKDKAGVAFNKDPYKAFDCGNAVIREYNYKYPRKLKKIRLGYKDFEEKKDSIISMERDKYDCIWITKDHEIQVLNNRN